MIYIFNDCELDMRLHTLHRAGVHIPLGPKAFSVLVYLLQHRDRITMKQELVDLIWPDQIISDAALARCIASLRKAIGDTGGRQQIIHTLYGRGYRLITAVEERPIAPVVSAVRMVDNPSPVPPQAHRVEYRPHSDGGALDGELQEVTVLCGALAHTEELAARLAPDAMHRVLHEFFEHACQAVQHSGGVIQALLDDSFLALFGVPISCEDHAQQAVQAAMRLRESLHTHSAAPGTHDEEAMRVRFSVHTGMVVGRRIGNGRRLTYMAVGDTVRWAMRLQELAGPDMLVLSDTTARRVQDSADIGACGLMTVSLREPHSQWLRTTYVMNGQ